MLRFALPVVLLLIALAPAAWAGNIVLVLSDSSGPYAEFSNTLGDALENTSWKITAAGKLETLDLAAKPPDLLVTAGAQALRQVLAKNGTTPVLATLLPRQSFDKTLADAGKLRGRVSAIYLDQPPARQAAFLRHLLPGQKQIGLLLSQETRAATEQYRRALAAAGLTLDSEDVDTDIALLPALNTLLPRVNALLAIPDASIYKRDNIKAILVTSYRHRRPVVGFSAAFVTAGALAALYTTPAQIARQTADLIASQGIALPAAALPPSLFAVAINQNVVEALGLSIPDEASIRRAMLADREAR